MAKDLSKVKQRALQGSALGPWGAAGGAIIGGVETMFGGGEDDGAWVGPGGATGMGWDPSGSASPKAGPGSGGNVNPAAFQAPTAGEYFGPKSGQPGAWWLEQAGVMGGNKGHVGDSRYQRNQARQSQRGGMDLLGAYARGDKSAARLAAKAQQDATIQAIQSRAAATPGGWNPSVQAAAIGAQSAAGQQLAGQTAAAAAKEQLAAQRAYLQAAGQMRGQDLAGQLAEQQWYQQQAAVKMAYQNMKAKYLAMGLQEKDADRRARMDLERMKWQGGQNAAGRSLDQQKLDQQQGQYDTTRADNYLMGTLKAGGDYLANQGFGKGDAGPKDYWDW